MLNLYWPKLEEKSKKDDQNAWETGGEYVFFVFGRTNKRKILEDVREKGELYVWWVRTGISYGKSGADEKKLKKYKIFIEFYFNW